MKPNPRTTPNMEHLHPSLSLTGRPRRSPRRSRSTCSSSTCHRDDRTAPLHRQQSQLLVPMDTPGITLVRPMLAMGEDDAPKGNMELRFDDVRVPAENLLGEEGAFSELLSY
mgnify:CR=1 FL=1